MARKRWETATVVLDVETRRRLEEAASRRQVSMTAVMRWALEDWLKREPSSQDTRAALAAS